MHGSAPYERASTRPYQARRRAETGKGPPPQPVDEQLIDKEGLRELYALISRLSYLDRTLVALYLDGLSYPEMSEVLGMTSQNAGVRVHRIKDKLRQMGKAQA